MDEVTVKRSADLIAQEINGIKEQTRSIVIYNSIEIGRRLCEAKEIVEHGEWSKWLEEKVDYSKSTANNLMKIFKEYGAEQISLLGSNVKDEIYSKLNYSQAVELLGVPEEEREKFIKENNIEEMSTRKLKEEIKALKDKGKELENKLSEATDSKNNLEKQYKSAEEEKRNLNDVINGLQEQIEKHNKEVNPVIADLESKLKEANNKITELEERPIEVNTEPSEAEKAEKKGLKDEIQRLKKQIDKMNKEKDRGNTSVTKFGMCITDISEKFNAILNIIDDEIDKSLKDKLIKAANNAVDKLKETLMSM